MKLTTSRSLAAVAGLAVAATLPARGQVWNVGGGATLFTSHNLVAVDCVHSGSDTQPALVPGLLGSSRGAVSGSGFVCAAGLCELGASGFAEVFVFGEGTNTLRIVWRAMPHAEHSCYNRPLYKGEAIANVTAALGITPVGLPAGSQVNVTYRWRALSWNGHDPEIPGAPDDENSVDTTFLAINGAPVYGGAFDLVNINGFLQQAGFATIAGAPIGVGIPVGFGVNTSCDMNNPGVGFRNDDGERDYFEGELVLRCANAVDPPVLPADFAPCPATQQVEFSLDIGSDSAFGDPNGGGNNLFDPGDSYIWHGFLTATTNGSRDDALIFGADPAPTPAVVGVPTCTGSPMPVAGFFDLDDEDSLDFDLRTLPGYNGAGPCGVIVEVPSACVYGAQNLIFSYDEDGPMHYTGNGFTCQVPVNSSAPSGKTYGGSKTQDEVLSLTTMPGVAGNAWAAMPLMSEFQLHQSLWPYPDGPAFAPQPNNDDVDALDVNGGGCGFWMFTPDHEASMGLNPGDVYIAGSPIPVVRHGTHLGLPDGVDIRGLEFVWTGNPGQRRLTMLFTVAPDDPLTAANETGGLNPAMIYASFMDGANFPFLNSPLNDPVDAIAASCTPIAGAPKAPAVFDAGYVNRLMYDGTGGCANAPTFLGYSSGSLAGAPQRWSAQPFTLQSRTTITEIDPQGFTPVGSEFTTLMYIIWHRLPGNPAPTPGDMVAMGGVPAPAYTDDTDHVPTIQGVVARMILPAPLTLDAGDYYLTVYGDIPVVPGTNANFGWYANAQADPAQVPPCTPIPLFAFGGPGGGGEFMWRSVSMPPGFGVYAPGLCTINIDPAPPWGPVPQSTDYRFNTAFAIRGIVPTTPPVCWANCDGSVAPPCLNVQDFACFLNRFANGDPWANCDGSVTPPVLNVQDFACFLNKFAAGCPGGC